MLVGIVPENPGMLGEYHPSDDAASTLRSTRVCHRITAVLGAVEDEFTQLPQ